MHTVIASLESVSPYSQSKEKDFAFPRGQKETAQDHEKRTWMERCHYEEKTGIVFIPPMAFKNCLSECAKFLSIQIPGEGKKTYTKHFESGLLILEGIKLGVKKENVKGEWLFVPSDGRRGGGKRVKKCFPLIPEWRGDLTIYVLDDKINRPAPGMKYNPKDPFTDILRYHLEQAGAFIGIGRFRPRNNGFYGRFKVNDMIWEDGK